MIFGSLALGVARFEVRYQVRRFTFFAAAAFFVLTGFMMGTNGIGPQDVHLNSPYTVAYSSAFLSLLSVFALTLFVAQSVLRDTEYRMAEIVYTTSVDKTSYLYGRFLAALLAGSLIFSLAMLTMAMASAVSGDPSRLGAFRPEAYLWAFLVLVLPNLLFVASVLFAIAAITRRQMTTWIGGVSLYLLYFAAALLTDSPLMASSGPPTPGGLSLASLVDPFGLSAFFEQTHYWTAAERNQRLLALRGPFLVNRLIWTLVTVAILGLTYRLFAFRVLSGRQGGSVGSSEPGEAASVWRPVASQRGRSWQSLVSLVRSDVRAVVRSRVFGVLLLLFVSMLGIELFQRFRAAEFGTVLVPDTGLVLQHLWGPFQLFALLALLIYSSELVWRARTSHMDALLDSTPAPSWTFAVAKIVALSGLMVLLGIVALAVGALFQVVHGQTPDPLAYGGMLGLAVWPLILAAVLVVVVHALSANRHLGLLVSVFAVLFLHRGVLGGPDHPLLRYAVPLEIPFSAMNGFSPSWASLLAFLGYWTVGAWCLGILATMAWPRGTDLSWRERGLTLRHALAGKIRWLAVPGVVWLAAGGVLFHQTHVAQRYETADDLHAWKAGYETAYAALKTLAQPTLIEVATEVDLFPRERRYLVRGRYRLENRTTEPIVEIWMATRRDLDVMSMQLSDNASRVYDPAVHDPVYGMVRFDLEAPLAVGEAVDLSFEVGNRPHFVSASQPDLAVVENGSFLLSVFVLPTVGYRESYEERDPDARRRQGLPAVRVPELLEEALASGGGAEGLAPMKFEAVVSTSEEQTAIAPGELVEQWNDGGRAYYRYRVDRAVQFFFGFVSARYQVADVEVEGVEIEIYHHPGHERNIERMLEASRLAFDYCRKSFGPYPYSTYKIVEIPSHWDGFGGLALPGIFYFPSHRGFLTDTSDPHRIDVVSKRVAHEVSHQWWGHQLAPATLPGASVLVESLARYTELMVLRDLHGDKAWTPVLEVELDRYLSGRVGGDEVPLYHVGDQAYLFYAKGALLMHGVRDLIGEDALNRVLRSLLDDFNSERPPTTRDFLTRLQNEASPEHGALIEQWFKEIVLYDLKVNTASVEPTVEGKYKVVVDFGAEKWKLTKDVEEVLSFGEWIDVEVTSGYPGASSAKTLYREPLFFDGERSLEILVDEKPAFVAIDPDLLRIDRHRANNVRSLDWVD